MIKIFLTIILFAYIIAPILGQQKDSKDKSTFSTAAIVDEKDLFPEGIAFDSMTIQIFQSSIVMKKLLL